MEKAKVITTIPGWREKVPEFRKEGKTIGFVPTMGAIHKGHISLIERSVSENDVTLVSIFVNPTQFNNPDDFNNYPVTFDEDIRKISEAGAAYVFYPDHEDLYRDNYRYVISEKSLSKILCGAFRAGHFDGVLTVVLKLLLISGADRAYFGEKDYQQFKLIEGMAEAFFLDTKIIPCPILREPSGLALSSRNALLSEQGKAKAPLFYQHLKRSATIEEARKKLAASGFEVEYVEEHFNRRFGAVYLDSVRLIDNVPLTLKGV